MANAFSKEEIVAFEDILEGFQDALVLSRNVSVYRTNARQMERASDVIWRPQPYIAVSYDGFDQTSNFQDNTQLSVPATIGFRKSVPWVMTDLELRDAMQEGRLGDAAKQKLASDINVAIMNRAANEGTVVVKRTVAATGFDDVAQCDAAFNELGVQMDSRYLALSSRDYNNMASNLAARQTMNSKPTTAYEKAYVGNVAGFETYKLDYANRLAARTALGWTLNQANAYYTPQATSTAATGEVSNVDNRYQTITVTVGAGSGTPVAGDCFTIAGVNSVHHITKQDTGQLKTFRIISVNSATSWTISPPIISAGGGTDAEKQYQNVSATPATTAAITMLNTVTANVNPFWHKDAIEILPGTMAPSKDAGVNIMTASTDQGFEVVMAKQSDINTLRTKYRLDVRFGTVMKQPEMAGLILFSQT